MSSSLEQLVNDYLDHELSAKQAAQVEDFLCKDVQAKRIHDEILAIRKAIRSLPEAEIPDNFQNDLFRNIAVIRSQQRPQETTKHWGRFDWKERLRNPRIWAYPLAVLVIVGSLVWLGRIEQSSPLNQNVANHSMTNHPADEMTPEILAPLSLKVNEPLAPKSGPIHSGTVLEIFCELSPEALQKHYMYRVLAERGIASLTKTSGISKDIVYEVELTPGQLIAILETMYADRASVRGLKVPANLSSLFERKPSDDPATTPINSVKVRFILKDAL